MHLASDEVHCWSADLDVTPETLAALWATLTDEERDRCRRLRFAHHRARFIAAHGALHDVLARYTDTPPGAIRFTYNGFGKPALDPECGGQITFNLTHSADVALIAVSGGAEVGVDVEQIRPQQDVAEIGRGVFAPAEAAALDGLPSLLGSQVFYSCWTIREAYLKARGDGLALLDGGPVDRIPGRWSLFTLQPAPGYVGALVIEGKNWRLRQQQWEAPSLAHASA